MILVFILSCLGSDFVGTKGFEFFGGEGLWLSLVIYSYMGFRDFRCWELVFLYDFGKCCF